MLAPWSVLHTRPQRAPKVPRREALTLMTSSMSLYLLSVFEFWASSFFAASPAIGAHNGARLTTHSHDLTLSHKKTRLPGVLCSQGSQNFPLSVIIPFKGEARGSTVGSWTT